MIKQKAKSQTQNKSPFLENLATVLGILIGLSSIFASFYLSYNHYYGNENSMFYDVEVPDHLTDFDHERFLRNYACGEQQGFKFKIISREPLVASLEGFLQEGEAEHLQIQAIPFFERSLVTDNATSDRLDDGRTSFTTMFPKSHDQVVKCIEERAARLVNVPSENVEPLQVVRYKKGQQYRSHYDYFGDSPTKYSKELEACGDRLATIFVYLTTVPEGFGGHTSFEELGLRVPAKRNNAAFWYNLHFNGSVDDRMLHAGDLVRGDVVKYGLNVWVREKSYAPCEEELE